MRPDGFYAATWHYGEKLELCQFIGDKDGGHWLREGVEEPERREPIAIIGPLWQGRRGTP